MIHLFDESLNFNTPGLRHSVFVICVATLFSSCLIPFCIHFYSLFKLMSYSTPEVGESPPAYGTGNTEVNVSNSWTTGAAASGVAMVTCRVCQALIDISGKRDQHVVKCGQCHEATVSK